MLDTLVELIQGPCKENQRSLVSSKSIDNCRDILTQGSSERELKLKGLGGEKAGMIDELK
jgi:RyR and IP3R Homology associated